VSPMPKQRTVERVHTVKLQSKFVYMLDLGLFTEATGQLHTPAAKFTERGPSVHIAAPLKICAGCKASVDEYGFRG